MRKKDSEGAFFYQIITEKDETVKIAQVQQLLELSFISADIILSEVRSIMDIIINWITLFKCQCISHRALTWDTLQIDLEF